MLVDDRLPLEIRDRGVDICATIAGDEECCIGFRRNVLDVNMMTAMLTKTLQDHVRLFSSFQRIDKRILAAGEIVILNVDDQEGSFHGLSITYTGRHVTGTHAQNWYTCLCAYLYTFLHLKSHHWEPALPFSSPSQQ